MLTLALGLSMTALAVVALGTFHVQAMLRFTATGERTPNPEALGLRGLARVLVFGVRIPRPVHAQVPLDRGHPYREVWIPVADAGVLGAWDIAAIPCSTASPRVAVLFHGYAAASDQLLSVAEGFLARGYRVVLVDFRGCGRSSGTATGLGTTEAIDVAAAVRWAAGLGDPTPTVYGFSLGAAAVLMALSAEPLPVRVAIVEASFGRMRDTVVARFRALGLHPMGLDHVLMLCGSLALRVNGYRLAPEESAANIGVPLLVLHGARDDRVSEAEARRIATAAGGSLLVHPGVGHQPLSDVSLGSFDAALSSIEA